MSQHWAVRAISHPTADTDLAILVTFDNAKYLFNCGEGTQRAFVQGKMSLKKLQGVFVTGAGLGVVGGLPGILMSAADASVKQTVIAGPEGLYQYLASCRTFVQRDSLTVNLPHPAPATHEIHKTASITIKAIPIAAIPPSSAAPGTAPAADVRPESGAFHWKDRKVRLNQLTDVQLRWWRRLVISDMFGGWQRYAAQTALPAPSEEPSVEDHRASPSRFHMPQVLPRRGADAAPDGDAPAPVGAADRDHMAYVLQAPPVRGKFNADKARALGVPSGPIRGRLTKGEAIEVDDPGVEGGKRVIRPEDVLGDTVPGAVCIVVDVAPEHILSVVENEAFKPYMEDAPAASKVEHQTHLIIHRTTADILADERYRQWMRGFGSQVHHVVADPTRKSNDISFSSAAWNLLRMSQVDSEIFAPPIGGGEAVPGAPESEAIGRSVSLQPLRKGLFVRMHPPTAPEQLPENLNNPSFPTASDLQRAALDELATKNSRYLALTIEAQRCVAEKLGEMSAAPAPPQDDTYGISIVPLGTGSAIPSKYRNVSSTLLNIPGFGHMLLDAGEGTLGQLRRRFGADLRDAVYKTLRFVFISHMHADHHLGLQRVLVDWQANCPGQTLYLVGPSYIWLHLVENGIVLGDNIRFMDCFHLLRSRHGSPSVPATEYAEPGPSRQDRTLAVARECMEELGLTELQTPLVTHRGRANGLVLTHTSGWKIVYSGDTTPCQTLVDAGRDATLLIHEATLEDDKPEMALAKGHSTFGQAIDVGTRMQAKYLLLNHFSQRYPKLPRLQPVDPVADPSAASYRRPTIALAFDLMTLPLASFWKMAQYTEALEELFSEVEAAESDAGSETSERKAGAGMCGADGKAKGGSGGAQKRKAGETNGYKAGKDQVPPSSSCPAPAAKRTKSGERDVVMRAV